MSGGPRGLQLATLNSQETLELQLAATKVSGDTRVATLKSPVICPIYPFVVGLVLNEIDKVGL